VTGPAIDDSPPPRVPARSADGHKGTFGTVLIVGGCVAGGTRMIGAPALAAAAATAAFRAGAGLVKVLAPAPVLDVVLGIAPSATGLSFAVDSEGLPRLPECIESFDRALASCNALVVGPGLGSLGTSPLVLRAIQHEDAPVVLDADALNVLAEIPELWRDFRCAAVITPHPGEFRRLAQAFKITEDPDEPERRGHAAAALAQRLGCIVVLKGAGTVVTDGLRAWVSNAANPVLGTAGTGDVLAGLMGGLLAQHARRPKADLALYDIARIAVRAHALAAEAWAGTARASGGMLALELAACLPAVLESQRMN